MEIIKYMKVHTYQYKHNKKNTLHNIKLTGG